MPSRPFELRLETPRLPALCTALVALALSLGGGPAQASHTTTTSTSTSTSSSTTPCSQRMRLAWTMPLKDADIGKSASSVLTRSEFKAAIKLRDPQGRVAIGRVPGGGAAIQMNIPKGENKLASIMWAPFGSTGVGHACLRLEVYVPGDFNWGSSGAKLGFGLWGGSIYDQSGGTLPRDQQGWSVRNVHNYKSGLKLYSYHLNRSSSYGVSSSPGMVIPRDRRVPVDIEVKMNTVGKADGFTKLWVNGKYASGLSNLVFRTSTGWAIRGIKFSDMWSSGTPSPKAQKLWYANYRLYTP
jgi:hypothetical protein